MIREPLPADLAGQFSVAAALERGISADRLRTLPAPFRGIRTLEPVGDSVLDAAKAFSPRLRPSQFFSHRTAALLWRIPLPGFDVMPLHVTTAAPGRPPSGKGIVGHCMVVESRDLVRIAGLPVTSAPRTWALLTDELAIHDLVAAAEYLVTGVSLSRIYPLTTLDELRRITARLASSRGHRNRIAALEAVRPGPLSRPESLVRLVLVRSGIPEPEINVPCLDEHGGLVAVPDLRWPRYKVALEYEGDHHRDVAQFRRDIQRIERLVDAGWIVVKVSADDLFARPGDLVRRVARRLTARGWHGVADLRFSGHFER